MALDVCSPAWNAYWPSSSFMVSTTVREWTLPFDSILYLAPDFSGWFLKVQTGSIPGWDTSTVKVTF